MIFSITNYYIYDLFRILFNFTTLMKIPGLTFSWKRTIGLTQAKQKIARATGIPLTKQGLERKIGNAILKGAKKLIK